MKLIAPSILSADASRLGEEIIAVEKAGADWIHLDVMDGNFVPNITMGPAIISALRKVTKLPFDVHLMIADPDRYIESFFKAGADIITVHVEASTHLHRTVELIKSFGAKAGVSLNPATSLDQITEIIHYIDLLLIMTVNPGFGGQAYIPFMEEKIKHTRKLIEKSGRKIALEVDGGIKANNAEKVVRAGADVLVMGTEIFHSKDYKAKIREIRKKIG